MKHSMKLLPLVAAIASCISAGAYAQENAKKPAVIEEIFVTAQRKVESLSDVPLAITAVDSQGMADNRIEDVGDIAAISPSVQVSVSNNAAASTNIIIRGLGTVGNSSSFEGGVGVFIDGVYRTRSGAALESFLDIGNLQIVRGPQGTLFGKNTSAGAILINSTQPSVEETQVSYEVGAGNYGANNIKAAINIPTSDTSALRVAGLYSDYDGFYTDVNTGESINGKETKALKAQWYSEATDKLKIHVIADTLESEGNQGYATIGFIDSPTTELINFIQRDLNGLSIPSNDLGDFEVALNAPGDQTVDDKGIVASVEYEVDAGTIKSTTAYRKFSLFQANVDNDFVGADLLNLNDNFESDFFSQEFTFSSNLDALNAEYIVGAFYSKEDLILGKENIAGSDLEFFFGTALAPLGLTVAAPVGTINVEEMAGENTSIAVFSHVTFELNDYWKLITGLRYSEEEKFGSFRNSFYDTFGGLNPFVLVGASPGPDYAADHKDEAFSGTLGLQYFIGDNSMTYLTYNRGFKAGGVNINQNAGGGLANNPAFVPGAIPLDPTFEAETVDALELGLKSSYWDNRANTNIAAFYNKVSDLQVAQFVGLAFAVLNADSAENYGLEFENIVRLSDVYTATLAATWLPHAEYGESDIVDPAISGQRTNFAPKITANVGIAFDQPISDIYSLRGGLKYQYKSSQFINSADTVSEADSVGLVNANIVLVAEDQGWQFEFWGQNLTDESYATVAFNSPAQAGDVNAYAGAPRTYGVTLRGSF